MPLELNAHSGYGPGLRLPSLSSASYAPNAALRIALVNNMPDAALEDTERQFCNLLQAAAQDRTVCLTLHCLPGVPRGPAARARLEHHYAGLRELLDGRYDGIIVTGTEPCQADLRQEPYWPAMTQVFEWADRHARSAIYSCLAAHAAVLHADNLPRHALPEKLFGVFDSQVRRANSWIGDGGLCFPHSRWNDVRESELSSCGYVVAAGSAATGADVFLKLRGRCHAVYLQGHPEYEAATLLKEYRRDVRRFFQGERGDYPPMPHGYFDPSAQNALREFQMQALAGHYLDPISAFPDVAAGALRRWEASAVRLYRNWLKMLAADAVVPRAAGQVI